MYVYCITNTLNGMKYVGMTSRTIEESREYYGSGVYITRAVKKLGKQHFKKEIIEVCDNIEDLKEREKYWIKTLNTKKPYGYNLTDGGDGVVNLCEESKKRQIEKLKMYVGEKNWHYGKKRSEETKLNMSLSQLGKTHKEETKQKLREINLGRVMPPHSREALIKANTGRVYKQESIDLIRQNQPTCTPILQFTKEGEFVAEYFSMSEAERCSGVARSSICRCCKGELKSAGKFVWKYKN
jgi:group I intron endonuclease